MNGYVVGDFSLRCLLKKIFLLLAVLSIDLKAEQRTIAST
jgi:hypothetical protein